MWYNITRQLHQKVDQLRHILVGKLFLGIYPLDLKLLFQGHGANLKSDINWPKISLEKGKPSHDDDLGKTPVVPEEKPQIPLNDASENKIPSSPAKVC